ncbi:GntR family transcriptional regulator [Agrobacterium rosae]|uniref:GntR family transcriptional regulator n=1 Tax=Agrobacterium rosae TaxID=1972867 RepID=UPI003A803500
MERKRRTLVGMSSLSRTRAQTPRIADMIYKELHLRIVSMQLKPNDQLSEKELLLQFGVSRTPLREAILRLADDGLLTIYPQSGTFVSPIPVRLLQESILIRKALETVIVEAATLRVSDSDIEALDFNLAETVQADSSEDLELFHRLDGEFHKLIGRVSGLETVMGMIEHVQGHINRYRLLTLPQEGRLKRVIHEHRLVRDAMCARDPAAAGQAMAFHIGQMLMEVEALEALDREYFHDDRKSAD